MIAMWKQGLGLVGCCQLYVHTRLTSERMDCVTDFVSFIMHAAMAIEPFITLCQISRNSRCLSPAVDMLYSTSAQSWRRHIHPINNYTKNRVVTLPKRLIFDVCTFTECFQPDRFWHTAHKYCEAQPQGTLLSQYPSETKTET